MEKVTRNFDNSLQDFLILEVLVVYVCLQCIGTLGHGTNNFAEMSSLRILVWLVVEKEIQNIEVFKSSQIIIKWINGLNRIHNIQLILLLE